MSPSQLAIGLRQKIPTGAYSSLRRAYLSICFVLGPKVGNWRQKRATRNPITHMDKVRRKMAFDRDPMLTTLCDKIKIREIVGNLIGAQYLTNAYFAGYELDQIDWAKLPREYVCKVNHGAGGVIVVREGADRTLRLPTKVSKVGWTHFEIHPDNAEPTLIRALLQHWLALDYSWRKETVLYEWAYKDIKRGVLIEELLSNRGEIPNDYKFYVVNGEVKLIREQTHRFSNNRGLYEYDRGWNLLGTSMWDNTWERLLSPPPEIPNLKDHAPEIATELVRVAERIGLLTDALRVDLYAVGSRIVFGETTIYPNAGNDFFTSEWLNTEVAKDWHPNY